MPVVTVDAIQLNPADNLAVAARLLEAGESVEIAGKVVPHPVTKSERIRGRLEPDITETRTHLFRDPFCCVLEFEKQQYTITGDENHVPHRCGDALGLEAVHDARLARTRVFCTQLGRRCVTPV